MSETQAGSRERRLLQSESRWLQKAVFALSKAEADREKLAELRGVDATSMTVVLGKKSFEIDVVNDAVRASVEDRLEAIRAKTKKRWSPARG